MPSGANAACTARAIFQAARIRAAAVSSSMSIKVSNGFFVATITWPSLTWPASMKANTRSSS
jgi:hypothetical protein